MHLRKPQEVGASNLNSLIQRVAGISVMEIDNLIAESQRLRTRHHRSVHDLLAASANASPVAGVAGRTPDQRRAVAAKQRARHSRGRSFDPPFSLTDWGYSEPRLEDGANSRGSTTGDLGASPQRRQQ